MSTTLYSRLWFTYDDQGKKIPLRAYRELQRRVAVGSATDVMIDRATNLYASHFPKIRVGILMGMFIGACMLLVTGMSWWWAILPMMAAPIAVMLILNRRILQRIHGEMADVFVGEGVCAGCAYPLSGLRVDSSGRVVCPECSASWNESRIIRFAEISKKADSPVRQMLRRLGVLYGGGQGNRSIRDDREVFRTAASMRVVRRVCRENTDEDCDTRLRSAQRRLSRVGRGLRLAYASLLLLMIIFQVSAVVGLGIPSRGLPGVSVMILWLMLVPTIIFSGLIVFVLRGDMGRKGKKARKVLLTNDLCPSCVADLEGIEPEEDGCTVCQSCGSAWKLGGADEQR